jgi:hypothetical protein
MRCLSFLLFVLVGSMFCDLGWTQQYQTLVPQPVPAAAVQYAPTTAPVVRTYTVGSASQPPEIVQLVKQLSDAEDSAKKADLTKQLEAAIAKSFDSDMEGREDDLSKLEDRVKKLRVQLDRRRRAKDDIIQLQLKVHVNEAEGLGFTSRPRQTGPATTVRGYGAHPAAAPASEPTSPSYQPRPGTKSSPR